MEKTTTSKRLQSLMDTRGLRQVDILRLAQPYCIKYDVKLGKNDLSQYVNGKTEPGQEKLTILGLALNVSEAWLMGYDVPMERKSNAVEAEAEAYDAYMKSEAAKMHLTISDTDPQIDELVRNAEQLNAQGKQKLVELSDDMVASGKYRKAPLDQAEVAEYRKQLRGEGDGSGA